MCLMDLAHNCKYCTGKDEVMLLEGNFTECMSVSKESDGTWHIDCYGSISGEIKYCPMCGRPLCKKKD